MFPFTLAGPQFLLFYALLAAALIAVYRLYLSAGSAGAVRLSQLTDDPYQIAYLRGGPGEAVRVAVVNLLDRGLLATDGPGVKATSDTGTALVRRRLDRSLLAACARTRLPRELEFDAGVRAACEEYEARLGAKGLLLTRAERATRATVRNAVLLILGGVAAARIAQALMRGQHNLVFLVLLAAAALFIVYRMVGGLATASGKQTLSSLEVLMRRVQRQPASLRPGGATNDALMLAAVLGVHALPAEAFPYVGQLFPAAAANGWRRSDGSSSCGSGSSCSSSGSSCGGGGGGGCGGCGGGD